MNFYLEYFNPQEFISTKDIPLHTNLHHQYQVTYFTQDKVLSIWHSSYLPQTASSTRATFQNFHVINMMLHSQESHYRFCWVFVRIVDTRCLCDTLLPVFLHFTFLLYQLTFHEPQNFGFVFSVILFNSRILLQRFFYKSRCLQLFLKIFNISYFEFRIQPESSTIVV